MKKHILLGMAMAVLIKTTNACGICGCPSAGTYLGVLPQYQKHFIGLRYNYRSFETTHPASIIPGLSGRKSTEIFQGLELIGRYVPSKRWQIIGILPAQQMQKTIGTETTVNVGIGDATVIGYYSVLPGKPKKEKGMIQLLQLGTGIKLPTGKNEWADENSDYNPAFQQGSGSFDGILSAIYTLRKNNFGLLTDASFQWNGKNKFSYQFGNKLSGSSRVFYTFKKNDNTWMFHTGIYAENSMADYLNNKFQHNTGGSIIMPMAGIDFYSRRISTGINYRTPSAQNLFGGYVKSKARLLFSVSYIINTK